MLVALLATSISVTVNRLPYAEERVLEPRACQTDTAAIQCLRQQPICIMKCWALEPKLAIPYMLLSKSMK